MIAARAHASQVRDPTVIRGGLTEGERTQILGVPLSTRSPTGLSRVPRTP